ncbi:hypothetical protein IT41_17975 [Paracoccus halophilus]|uniref:Uncharacterized protein n=1 Tax=Paracoccus halophilus TaxID=376733 RepID=A0A099EW90_9RHOB|nr:hypothetical protein IT41_17975 [Paracoccus halophilus]
MTRTLWLLSLLRCNIDDDLDGVSRYVMTLTPWLRGLIDELHTPPFDGHADVMKRYRSEIVD